MTLGLCRVGFRKHFVFLGFEYSFGCDAVRLVLRSDSSLKKSFKKISIAMCPCETIANAWAQNNVNIQQRIFHPCRGQDKIVQV